MKDKKHPGPKNTKFVRINNSIWIEADAGVPDEVARLQFYQKIQLAGNARAKESNLIREN
ncbi:MAG: hypothetical protein WCE64_16305 [Bacteroidales bacterium]